MNPTKEDTAAPQAQVLEEELLKYELMMIFAPDISQEETEKELNKVRKEITKNKGEIYHEDIWDVRDLAYMIKKFDKGYYVIFYFTLDGTHLKEMEKDFLLNAKILRHLIVKSPKNYEIKKLEELMAPSEERKPQEAKDARPKHRAPAKKVTKKEEKEEKPEPEVAEVAEVVEEKPTKPEPEVVEKAEEVEEKPEKPEKVEPKEEEKKPMDISDLDSKLESILDDPDINIKL